MSDKSAAFATVLKAVRESEPSGKALREFAMAELDRLPGYDWSGVYVLRGDSLHVDAYVGAYTDHAEIPVGRGVCGTAVAEDKNQVIEDVREIKNYLSCSLETRAEIVVLIRRGDEVLGQIDIDGHSVGAFDEEDERFLEELAGLLAERWD